MARYTPGGVYAYVIRADGRSFVVPKQNWSGSEWRVVWTACVWIELVVGGAVGSAGWYIQPAATAGELRPRLEDGGWGLLGLMYRSRYRAYPREGFQGMVLALRST